MKTIRMTVKGQKIGFDTEGFSGGNCLKETEQLKQRLGNEVGERQLRDEFYQEVDEEQFESERV